jgi:hypothetical protein
MNEYGGVNLFYLPTHFLGNDYLPVSVIWTAADALRRGPLPFCEPSFARVALLSAVAAVIIVRAAAGRH